MQQDWIAAPLMTLETTELETQPFAHCFCTKVLGVLQQVTSMGKEGTTLLHGAQCWGICVFPGGAAGKAGPSNVKAGCSTVTEPFPQHLHWGHAARCEEFESEQR